MKILVLINALYLIGYSQICKPSDQNTALDLFLQNKIQKFNLIPLQKIPENKIDKNLYNLGKALFSEKNISGRKNISCMDCHSQKFGTSDGQALGIGEGFILKNGKHLEAQGKILSRNTPALYNIGDDSNFRYFWDGRIQFDQSTHEFTTPLNELNGTNPEWSEITHLLKNGLAAQAIFPMINHDEMRGQLGSNEIADAKNEFEAWNLIVKRILKIPRYQPLILKAFPVKNLDEINIAHLGNAIAEFEKIEFQATNTPYDKYLAGDMKALSVEEKKGFVIFADKGNCLSCHNGPLLSNQGFRSIGIPEIASFSNHNDLGAESVFQDEGYKYLFKVPPLRNIALSAPYMHNGAFKTIEQVVDHYSDVGNSLLSYELNDQFIDSSYYNNPLQVNNDQMIKIVKIGRISPMVVRSLNLTAEEKAELVLFLKKSLSTLE